MKRERNLTDKQARFTEEYLIDLNATQAAIRAGYSPKMARRIAHQLLDKPTIQEAIQAAKKRRSERTGIEQDRILREEACIAFADLKNIFDEDGCTIPPHKLPDSVSRSLSSIEITETYDKEGNLTKKYRYRLWDKGRSLERIEKHLGMFTEKISVDLPKLRSAQDLLSFTSPVIDAVKRGSIGLSHGQALIALLEGHRKTLETTEIEARLAALEEKERMER